MTRLHGWRPTNQRVHYAAPRSRYKTTNFLAALRLGGLFTPLVVDVEIFAAYVRGQLAPQLRPGDIFVLDNLPTHKVRAAAAADAVHAHILFL